MSSTTGTLNAVPNIALRGISFEGEGGSQAGPIPLFVRVEEGEGARPGIRDASVPCRPRSAVPLPYKLDAAVRAQPNCFSSAVGRSRVNDDDLEPSKRLREYRIESPLVVRGLLVERDHDRHALSLDRLRRGDSRSVVPLQILPRRRSVRDQGGARRCKANRGRNTPVH